MSLDNASDNITNVEKLKEVIQYNFVVVYK